MELRPRPHARPERLIRLPNGNVALRVTGPDGQRMATHLRPMTLRDAVAPFRLRHR